MRHLMVSDVSVGVGVLYAGPGDDADVLDPARRAAGHILKELHPGVIHDATDRQHLIVRFFGLEDEPISWAVGFGHDVVTGDYPGLLIPDQRTWEDAKLAGWWASMEG